MLKQLIGGLGASIILLVFIGMILGYVNELVFFTVAALLAIVAFKILPRIN